MTTIENEFLSSVKLTDTSIIPDCWKTPEDVPTVEQICDTLKNDWFMADRFFFPESNDWRNYAEGTFEPLYDYQGVIEDTCENNSFVWIQASRGSAKSYTVARWLVSYCLRNPFQKAVIIAPSFRQSRMLWDYCAQIIKTNSQIGSLLYKLEADISVDDMKRGHEVVMTFSNGSTIMALPAGNGDTLRGTRATILVCDEFYLFPREIYTQHIMPFLNVQKGEKEAKVIHLTTSWYQDCFAYEVLTEHIARPMKQGRPGYAILDITIDDVIYSERSVGDDEPANTPRHFPASLKAVYHQLETSKDRVTGKLNDEAMMTFYNKWIKSSAAWYRTDKIEEARDAEVPILTGKPKDWSAPFVLGVDPAGMGNDKTQMCVGSLPGNMLRHVNAVYKWEKISPETIAGYIHKMVDLYGMYTIVMDKTGTLGADVAAKCAEPKQLIDGTWKDRQPITTHDHPDAGKARAQIVLTRPSDEKILQGFFGPRVDSTIGGEIELKNAFHRDMKSRLEGGELKFPRGIEDKDYFGDEPTTKGELLDNVREACGQLPRIDRETDRETKTVKTDGKGNYYFTRPPKDDGAYSMIYMNYAANIVYKEMAPKPRETTVRWSSLDRKQEKPQDTHRVVGPRL